MTVVLLDLTWVDLAVVAAVALVLPATLGGRWRWWLLAAAAVALSCRADRGSTTAMLLAAPWALVGMTVSAAAVREAGPLYFWNARDRIRVLAGAYGLVAAGGFVISRAGGAPFGIHEPIVELTAVHFTYAGPGALVLAGAAWAGAATPVTRRVGLAAVVLTAGAPPVVATGFLTTWAAPQVGGAVLMTLGVFATAALQLHRAAVGRDATATRVLLALSGMAVWVPMVLAVAWASAQHWDVPALSIDAMVRTHGAANAVGFIGAGLMAVRTDRTRTEVQAWR